MQVDGQRILTLKSPQLLFLLQDLTMKLEKVIGPLKLNPFSSGALLYFFLSFENVNEHLFFLSIKCLDPSISPPFSRHKFAHLIPKAMPVTRSAFLLCSGFQRARSIQSTQWLLLLIQADLCLSRQSDPSALRSFGRHFCQFSNFCWRCEIFVYFCINSTFFAENDGICDAALGDNDQDRATCFNQVTSNGKYWAGKSSLRLHTERFFFFPYFLKILDIFCLVLRWNGFKRPESRSALCLRWNLILTAAFFVDSWKFLQAVLLLLPRRCYSLDLLHSFFMPVCLVSLSLLSRYWTILWIEGFVLIHADHNGSSHCRSFRISGKVCWNSALPYSDNLILTVRIQVCYCSALFGIDSFPCEIVDNSSPDFKYKTLLFWWYLVPLLLLIYCYLKHLASASIQERLGAEIATICFRSLQRRLLSYLHRISCS